MVSRIPPERLAEVERRLLRAEAPADFEDDLAKLWSRTPRQIRKYVAIVRKRLAARAEAHDPEADRELIRGLLLRAYRTAEKGTEKGPDAKGMVAAARTMGELTGVVGPRRVEITGKDGGALALAAQVVVMPALEHDVPRDPPAADAAGAVAPEPGPAVALPGLDGE